MLIAADNYMILHLCFKCITMQSELQRSYRSRHIVADVCVDTQLIKHGRCHTNALTHSHSTEMF